MPTLKMTIELSNVDFVEALEVSAQVDAVVNARARNGVGLHVTTEVKG